MVLVSKVAEPTDMRHVLADQLIHQATFAKLERRGLIRALREELERLGVCYLVLIIFPIEKIGVHPRTSFFEKAPAFLGELLVFHLFRHLLSCPQSAHIPESHLGIGAEIVDIHSVMLRAFHNSVLIAVPTFLFPSERQSAFTCWPIALEERPVPTELPFPVEFHDAAHLAVRGDLGRVRN